MTNRKTIIAVTLLLAVAAALWFGTEPRIRALTDEELRTVRQYGSEDSRQAERLYGGAVDFVPRLSARMLLQYSAAGDGSAIVLAEYLGREEDTWWRSRRYLSERYRVTAVLFQGGTLTPIGPGGELTALELTGWYDEDPRPTPEEGGRYLLLLREDSFRDGSRAVLLADPVYCINRVDRWGRIAWHAATVREAAKLEGVTTLRAVRKLLHELAQED